MVETEGMLNTRMGEFYFLGRSIPIFPKHDLDVKPGGKAYLKIRIPFVEPCAKCLHPQAQSTGQPSSSGV